MSFVLGLVEETNVNHSDIIIAFATALVDLTEVIQRSGAGLDI